MCLPMSPFCSRLVISNYILAQILSGRSGSGLPEFRPVCRTLDFLVKLARRAIVRKYSPHARKIPAFNKEQTECQPPPQSNRQRPSRGRI